MKKYIGFILASSLIFSFSLVLAEEGSRVKSDRPVFNSTLKTERDVFRGELETRREAFREKMQTERKAFMDKLKTDREAFMAELKAKKEEWKSANSERKKEFWNKAKDMVNRRFEMAINNLTKVQERVGEVIDKLKADGKDTTDATEALNLSKQKLRDAKEKLAEIKALLPATTGETITPEIWEKIKLLAREAKDLLKESKEALHDAIKAIKSLKGENEDED